MKTQSIEKYDERDTKRIEWAYPTSPNADAFGLGETGCYTVEIVNRLTGFSRAIVAFSDIDQAEAYAIDIINLPWNRLTRRSLIRRT